MFAAASDDGYRPVLEKVELKTLTYGEKTLMAEFRLQEGASLPSHSHPHEQTGYLVSGRLVVAIGEESFVAAPGDSWTIPGDVEHSAQAEKNSVVIEVFTPVREDYLP